MVGHKFGEFVFTQKPSFFGKKASPLKTKVQLKKKCMIVSYGIKSKSNFIQTQTKL
jgi:hypothetical protein